MQAAKIIIATNNVGKLNEFKAILEPKGIAVIGLTDLTTKIEIVENGNSFAENALIKAQTIAKTTLDVPVIADDSGLMVAALHNEPGIYSARYASDHNDQANIDKVLAKLGDLPISDRKAKFHTTIAAVKPNGKQLVVSGEVQGYITKQQRGKNGFGYDPIFYSPELEKTFAQATANEKNRISHRSRAIEKLMLAFDQWWNED